MYSDFSMRAKYARAHLPVPDVPMSSILARSAARKGRQRIRAIALTCAISVAMAGTAAAFTTNFFEGVKLWLTGNSATIVIHSFAVTREPTLANVRRIVSSAAFPVTLPVGLPAGTRVWGIMYAPAEHPNVIAIQYQNDRGLNAGFELFDTKAIASGPPPMPGVTTTRTVHWKVGGETVLAGREAQKYLDITRIQRAMAASSPEQSLAATQPMLSQAIVLGPPTAQQERIARQYVRAGANAIVMGPFVVRQIPMLAKRGKPLIASNTTRLVNIPLVHGVPDYMNATLKWPRDVALTPAGVKAVAAVMEYAHLPSNCKCVTVVDRGPANSYGVWAVASGQAAKHYTVDVNTLKVTLLPVFHRVHPR